MAHPKRCFHCIESLATLGAPLAVWQRELGDSFNAVAPLLAVTNQIAQRMPGVRTDLPMMRVVDYRDGRFAAVCDEEMSPTTELTREQVVLHRVNETRMRRMLCKALSLIETHDDVSPLPGLLRIGTLQSSPLDPRPVILAVASSAAHLVELLLDATARTPGQMVLLTPTRARWSTRSEVVLDADRIIIVPLDEGMEWGDGSWRASAAWERYIGGAPPSAPGESGSALRIDPGTFTVWYGDKSCQLGNTIGFRALTRLARRPGVYISIERLLDDAWEGAIRSKSAVQKTISGLRKQLEKHGLHEVVIDGSQQGHYALKISENGKR